MRLTKLIEWRQLNNITLTGLGDSLGVSHSTVLRWEKGDILLPAERAVEISKLTGVPLHELRPDLWGKAA